MAKKSELSLQKAPPEQRLPWPSKPNELSTRPRVFRIHRLNAFEWQAYVILDNTEYPIGKPDLFDIVKTRVTNVMRAEGQLEFLAAKTKKETPGVQ